MQVYIFQADIYCEACGKDMIASLEKTTGAPPIDMREDSNVWPQGPYSDGGGEADCPQHCGSCGVFLDNPLTADGVKYASDAIREFDMTGKGNAEVIETWRDAYAAYFWNTGRGSDNQGV